MEGINNYLILFADLIGSTHVAVEANPSFYAKTYVASYHWAARQAMEFVKSSDVFPSEQFTKIIVEPNIAGDEALSFTPLDTQDNSPTNLEDIAASAVAFAYITKLYWLASPYNLQRILDKQFPRDVAIGIHIGPAVSVPTPPNSGNNEQIASLHINITKRIEGVARNGFGSRIFASYEVDKLFSGWLKRMKEKTGIRHRSPLSFSYFMPRGLEEVKGVPKKLQLFELALPTKDDNFESFLDQLVVLPPTKGAELVMAASILTEKFLPHSNKPFSYTGQTSAILAENSWCATRLGYVDHWFKAVNQLNRLFFDEYWLVLNCYFISCALLQHSEIEKEKQASYLEIAKEILTQQKDLMVALARKRTLLK